MEDTCFAVALRLSEQAGTDGWLVRVDQAGNELWNKTYGGTGDDIFWKLVQTSDGGYAMAGYTDSYGAGDYDYWLVKTDSSGNELWNKTYGGPAYDEARGLVQTSDGGYALSGRTYSFGAGLSDVWLVKVDPSGNLNGETGLVWTDSSANTITLYRGAEDPNWNYVRVRILMDPPAHVTGDINGDGRVDMKDIALVARAFGSTPTSPNWNPAADINGDGTVNMKDIALVARNFGQHL